MKRIHVFILLQLIWIGLLVGGLSWYHDSFNFQPLAPITITIMQGNLQDSTLILVPSADSVIVVEGKQKVRWKIAPGSNVGTFRIKKKDTSIGIFSILNPPPKGHTDDGEGKVSGTVDSGDKYYYDIFWKLPNESKERERRFDPKLAVNSSKAAPSEGLLIGIYAGLSLLSLMVLRPAKK